MGKLKAGDNHIKEINKIYPIKHLQSAFHDISYTFTENIFRYTQQSLIKTSSTLY